MSESNTPEKQEARVRRGLKWYNQRGRDGELPKGVVNDEGKMKDVNQYLDSIKPKEKSKEEKPKKGK